MLPQLLIVSSSISRLLLRLALSQVHFLFSAGRFPRRVRVARHNVFPYSWPRNARGWHARFPVVLAIVEGKFLICVYISYGAGHVGEGFRTGSFNSHDL